MTGDPTGEVFATRLRLLEERLENAEARAAMAEQVADQVFALAGLAQRVRSGPSSTFSGAGSLDSFASVVNGLAADLEVPAAEIIRRMIRDIEERVALDRSVLAHLHRLETADPASGPSPPLGAL